MRNEVRKMFLTCALFIGVMSLNAQLSQHGLLLNGGIGQVNPNFKKSGDRFEEMKYDCGFMLGYRLRFKKPMPQSFHYDTDVNLGAKFFSLSSGETFNGGTSGERETVQNSYISVGGTLNYSLIKNLSVGLGVEPAYCIQNLSSNAKNNFDLPVVAKIAYNVKYFEIGIYGKYGLNNVFEGEILQSGKIREIQLSLFIPFKTK